MWGRMSPLHQNPFFHNGTLRIEIQMATSKNPSMPLRSSLPLRASGGGARVTRAVLLLLVLLIVAGASVAITWFIAQRQPAQPANVQLGVGQAQQQPSSTVFMAPATTPAAVPAPIFIPLEAFTITLQNPDMDRILHVGITLRVNDEQTRLRIEKYMPEVRSRILMVLSAQSPATAQTVQGKADMLKAIADAVNRPFSPLPDGQYVSDVLFTAFVVQ